MILHDCVQGSERWLRLRAGLPTASEFDQIVTPGGMPSKSATKYCNIKIAEVMLGRPLGSVITPIMDIGKRLEEEAIKYYEFQNDVETVPIGFVTTDDGRVGASPDRLVGDRGLVEIKCPKDETHAKYLAAHIDALLGAASLDGVYEAYKVQCQGQLYVCERDYSDVVAYFPGLPEAITRVGRDESFIAKLKRELDRFLAMFDERVDRLKSLGYLFDVSLDKSAASLGPKVAGKKAEPKSKPEPDLGAFGFTDADMEAMIAKLKAEKKFRESGNAEASK